MSGCLSNLYAKLSSQNGISTIEGASPRSTTANAPKQFFCGCAARKSAKTTSASAARSLNLLANRLHAASLPVLSCLIKITVPYVPSPRVCSAHLPLHPSLYSATYCANGNLKHRPCFFATDTCKMPSCNGGWHAAGGGATLPMSEVLCCFAVVLPSEYS